MENQKLEEKNKIYVQIEKGTKIPTKVLPNCDSAILVTDSDKVQLFPNRIYRIPVNLKDLCDEDYVYIKCPISILEKMEVIGLERGYIIIIPRCITTLKSGTYIGYLLP